VILQIRYWIWGFLEILLEDFSTIATLETACQKTKELWLPNPRDRSVSVSDFHFIFETRYFFVAKRKFQDAKLGR